MTTTVYAATPARAQTPTTTADRPQTSVTDNRGVTSLNRTINGPAHVDPTGSRVTSARIADGDVRVLLLENIHPEAEQLLAAEGFTVETAAGALSEDELVERIRGVHLLGIRSTTYLSERVFDAAPDLLAVGAFCIGTNQIDLAAATRRGIAVFNAPFSNTRSVVEIVLAEIIALTRRLTDKNADMHAGIWDKSAVGSHEIRGRNLGIVGYGNIGSQLSVVAEALGMSVHFYDNADKLSLGNARRHETLDELLAVSDIVTLHVDGRPGNAGLFGEREFALMRPGSIFLNLSRGMVVDHDALREHVLSGHVVGAAVDVFPAEPRSRGDRFTSVLQGLRNVVLTPHVGGSTEEAQVDIGKFVATKLKQYVADGGTSLSVNLPPLNLPERAGAHRLVHTHENTPGVLATINRILADHGVNIDGQFLGTRGEVGYVITDIAAELGDSAVHALAVLPQTIKLRVLS